jgi:hypothetical protein
MAAPFYYGYPELPQAFEIISQLSDTEFQKLRDLVTTADAYDFNAERVAIIKKELGKNLTAGDILQTLASLRFLYTRFRRWEIEKRDTTKALREYLSFADLQEKSGDDPERFYKRIAELVAANPILERRRKLNWLAKGILETASDFSSFVDLRPRFSDDRKIIEEFLPTIIFRVFVQSDRGEDRSHVFQVNADGLAKLKAAVEDIERKLEALKTDESVLPRLASDLPGPLEDDC